MFISFMQKEIVFYILFLQSVLHYFISFKYFYYSSPKKAGVSLLLHCILSILKNIKVDIHQNTTFLNFLWYVFYISEKISYFKDVIFYRLDMHVFLKLKMRMMKLIYQKILMNILGHKDRSKQNSVVS